MAIRNAQGQARVGVRSPQVAPVVTVSSLLTGIYSVWNAETTVTTLNTSLYGAWNGDGTVTTLNTSLYGAWNGDGTVTTLNTSLYGAWNANGNNNFTVKNAWNANGNAVDSKSGVNGTIAQPSGTTFVSGTMSFGSGKLGSGAFTFDGTNFISLPNGSLNFDGDFSISCWIYVPTAFGTNYSRIISCYDNQLGSTTYRGWEVVYKNGTITLQIYPNGSDYYIISVPMTLKDQWVHVTAVRVLGQQGNIYINGVAGTKTVSTAGSATSASAIAYNGTSNLAYIGALHDITYSPRYSVTPAGGFKIDALQTWEVVLDQTAVTELYNSGNGQEYPFTVSNAIIGTTKDIVGTNNGVSKGGLTYTTGKIGNAFVGNGSNAYVQLPLNSFKPTSEDFTISAWVNFSGTSTSVQTIFSTITAISTKSYGVICYYYNNALTFQISDSSNDVGLNYTTNLFSSWNLVTITRKGGTRSRMYINGSLVASNTSTINPTYPNSVYPSILGADYGGSVPNQYFCSNGSKIDAVSVWNKELTGDEITALYNSGNGVEAPYSTSVSIKSTSDTIGTNHGTAVGGLTYSTGKVGNAFSFNGSSYINLNNDGFKPTGSFTFTTWAYYSNSSTTQTIATLVSSNGYLGFRVFITGNNVTFRTFPSGTTINELSTTNTPLSINTWNLITCVLDISSGMKIYVNGNLCASNSINTAISWGSTTINRIGVNWDGGTYYTGLLDSINMYSKALTADEVRALYNSGNGLEAPYSNSISVTTTSDSVGTNHGTSYGGLTYTTGKVGNSFQLNGTNTYITLPSDTFAFTGDFSTSVWVNAASLSTEKHILSNVNKIGGASGQWKGWHIFYYNGKIYFRIWNNGSNSDVVQTSAFNTNTWYHIVVTKSGSTQKIYINGVNEATNSSALTPNYSSPNYPAIGTSYYYTGAYANGGYEQAYCWNGKIDAITSWNKALTADEVTALYNSGNGLESPYSTSISTTTPNNKIGVDNGTPKGGLTYTTGKVGNAFLFNGTNARIDLDQNSLNFTGDFSVSMWVYITTGYGGNDYMQIQSMGCDSWFNNPFGWRFGTYGNTIIFQMFNHTNSYYNLNSSYIFTNGNNIGNAWYHVAMSRNATTGTNKLYINGSLVASDTNSYAPSYAAETIYPTIGNLYMGANGSKQNGYYAPNGTKMDAINIWSKELTQSEITELYNAGNGKQLDPTPIVTSGLVLNLDASRKSSYPNTGTTWYDISGNGYNGTMTGTTYATASSGVMSFNGSNNYVKIPLNLSTYSQITVEIWYKMNAGTSNLATWGGMLWEHSSDWNTNAGGFGLAVNSAGCSPDLNYMHTNHNGGSGPMNYLYNSGTTWSCHVNVFSTIADSTGRLAYVNGQLTPFVSTNNCNGPAWSTSTATTTSTAFRNDFLYLASRNGTGSFINGNIGLIRVYNRKLSATEIQQNYNATKSRFGL